MTHHWPTYTIITMVTHTPLVTGYLPTKYFGCYAIANKYLHVHVCITRVYYCMYMYMYIHVHVHNLDHNMHTVPIQ